MQKTLGSIDQLAHPSTCVKGSSQEKQTLVMVIQTYKINEKIQSPNTVNKNYKDLYS